MKYFSLIVFLAIALGVFLWLQEKEPEKEQLAEAALEEKLLEEKLAEVAAVERLKEEPKQSLTNEKVN